MSKESWPFPVGAGPEFSREQIAYKGHPITVADVQDTREELQSFVDTFGAEFECQTFEGLGVTVASLRVPGDRFKSVTITHCSPYDDFNKNVGKHMVKKKLVNGEYIRVSNDTPLDAVARLAMW